MRVLFMKIDRMPFWLDAHNSWPAVHSTHTLNYVTGEEDKRSFMFTFAWNNQGWPSFMRTRRLLQMDRHPLIRIDGVK